MGELRSTKLENFTERDYLCDLGIDAVIKLQSLLKNGAWQLNELNWLAIGCISLLL
jgi:hypothetical protein